MKKIGAILRAFKRSFFKIFCPPLRSGRLRRLDDLRDFLKRMESPFPLYPHPKSSLGGSISPMFLCLGGRKNWSKPKIVNPKKISKTFIFWLCKIWSKLVFWANMMAWNRQKKWKKIGAILRAFKRSIFKIFKLF